MDKLIQSRTTHDDGSVQYSLPWGKIKVSSDGDGLMQKILARLWEYEQGETTLVVKDMERLTFEGNFCDIAMCRENPCPYNGSCCQRETWERLKAYEDTGLDPEQVIGLCSMDKRSRMVKMIRWEEAEQEGRLVVLPCKVGDTVYKIDTDPQLDSREILELTVDNFVVCEDGGILVKYDSWDGVICTADNLVNGTAYLDYYRAFMAREEAEAALEGGTAK